MVTEEGGKVTSLKDLSAGKEFMVVLILGADCPLSKKALTEAAEDILKASSDGRVGIMGLLVARDDDEDIKRLKKEFNVTFPLYLDRDNSVAAKLGVPAVQIRAVSNFVEPRNRDAWNIGLAIENLELSLRKFFAQLD